MLFFRSADSPWFYVKPAHWEHTPVSVTDHVLVSVVDKQVTCPILGILFSFFVLVVQERIMYAHFMTAQLEFKSKEYCSFHTSLSKAFWR